MAIVCFREQKPRDEHHPIELGGVAQPFVPNQNAPDIAHDGLTGVFLLS